MVTILHFIYNNLLSYDNSDKFMTPPNEGAFFEGHCHLLRIIETCVLSAHPASARGKKALLDASLGLWARLDDGRNHRGMLLTSVQT